MIYLNSNEAGDTWRHLLEAGAWEPYRGQCASGDIVIRWGANQGRYSDTYRQGVTVLNKNLQLNKFSQLEVLRDAGVPIPKFWRSSPAYQAAGAPSQIVRKRISSIGGYGVTMVGPSQMMDGGTGSMLLQDSRGRDLYYQEYIAKDREFRAMMVGDTLAFVMEKFAPSDPGSRDIAWNAAQGAEWSAIGEERGLRTSIKDVAARALRALGYDFGAVDIMKKGNSFYVLEVNSKPEFGPRNCQHFVAAIESLLSSRATANSTAAALEDRLRRMEDTDRRVAKKVTTKSATTGLSSWNFCPYCAHALPGSKSDWAFCPYCAHSMA